MLARTSKFNIAAGIAGTTAAAGTLTARRLVTLRALDLVAGTMAMAPLPRLQAHGGDVREETVSYPPPIPAGCADSPYGARPVPVSECAGH
jgi:hypothetical protein